LKDTIKYYPVYTLETSKEKMIRIGILSVIFTCFLIFGYLLFPLITEALHRWVEFGIEIGRLLFIIGIVGTIILMRNVLVDFWKNTIKKITYFFIKTDLMGLLKVVIDKRHSVLVEFNLSIKKMLEAITLYTMKMEDRKKLMHENLEYISQFTKQSNDTRLDRHTRLKAKDQILFYRNEVSEDDKLLKIMQEERQKMLKSYNYFDRLYCNLETSTSSVVNTINRLADLLQSSVEWRDALQSASSLLGVSEFDSISSDEIRRRIVKNESEVMSMIHDHDILLMKMEADNGIIDYEGQKLLDHYSSKADLFMFLKNEKTQTFSTQGLIATSDISWLTETSWLITNKDLLK
jgi:hypothetical protein